MAPSSSCQEWWGAVGKGGLHSREGPATGWLAASSAIPDPCPAQGSGCCSQRFPSWRPLLRLSRDSKNSWEGWQPRLRRRGGEGLKALGWHLGEAATADHS